MSKKIEGQGAIFDFSPLNESNAKKSKRKVEKQAEPEVEYPTPDWRQRWINREWRKMTDQEKDKYGAIVKEKKPTESFVGEAATIAVSQIIADRQNAEEAKK